MKQPEKDTGPTRRDMFITGAGAMTGWLMTEEQAAAAAPDLPDVYGALGIKPVINAAGTFTNLGGSLMPPEVQRAWAAAAQHFVELPELQDNVGARIAKLIGVESALVTSGAAGALQVATAAVMTAGKPELVKQLPDTAGMKYEVITQKTHHTCYDQQLANCGAKLIDVETLADVDRAVSDRTALMLFYNFLEPEGMIKREEWVKAARKHGIPTLLDAAADVPPPEALHQYNKMGFDLVAFSGGKALRGPQGAGLLLGRKDLIEAAKRNTSPRCPTTGRGLKVSKEDMVAMLAAVERFVRLDHKAEWQEWVRRIEAIEAALKDVPTLKSKHIVPPIANHVPHLLLLWDEQKLRITPDQVKAELAGGDPPIKLGRVHGTGDEGLLVSVFMLKPDEVEVVAKRLRKALTKGA